MDNKSPGIFQWLTLLLLWSMFISGAVDGGVVRGDPRLLFSQEPPGKVEFINTKGTRIECGAKGKSGLTAFVTWTLVDGSPVTDIPALREVTSTGALVFHSFRPDRFRPDVHSAVYRCVASNAAGVIHSRDVNVRGVVVQVLDLHVYDTYAIVGNTAVFKCHVPTVLEEYVLVTAWIKNDNLLIQPTIESAATDKYAIMPTGELHIQDLTAGETGSKYKCKAHHRLTGDSLISSTAGQLFVTESRGSVQPRIVDSPTSAVVHQQSTVVLPCVAQGNPSPAIQWLKKTSSGRMVPIQSDRRFIVAKSSLVIKNAQISDRSMYICEAHNELGKERLEVNLVVTENLTAVIKPALYEATIGNSARFECEVNGVVADSSAVWLHNGIRVKRAAGGVFTIEIVQLSDQGIYQCVVKSGGEMAQATADLVMTEVAPLILESFNEVVTQPGSSVNVKCAAAGIPAPTISWDIDGIKLNDTSRIDIKQSTDSEGKVVSTLKIKYAAVEDGGLYTCTATNNGGEAVYSSRINVKGKIGTRESPKKLVISGSDAILSCPVYGYPIPEIIWSKDGVRYPNDLRHKMLRNGSLSLQRIDKKKDSGYFKCSARSENGAVAEGRVEVIVMVAPKLVPFQFQDDLLREGMRARLQCVVNEGDLPLNVTWLKDGMPIPSELGIIVRALDEFSSILTINSITPSHNGKYSCTATNRAAIVTHTAELSVNVPPKIVPFEFQELVEGLLVRVSCVVSRGDLPLKFLWEKDGVTLSSGDKEIQFKVFDEHSSILSIAEVAPEHNGMYTCVVNNHAGQARHSVELFVKVPPRWIVEPEDKSVLRGENVIIDCQADGFPKPSIVWSFVQADGLWTIEPKRLKIGDSIQIFSNGSLLIENVQTQNEGRYYCEASNGIGIGVTKGIEIKIHAPPNFKEVPKMINGSVEKMIQLQCTVYGDKPINVTWQKEENIIVSTKSHVIKETSTNSDILSTLIIESAVRNDNGNYSCIAQNRFGKNSYPIEVIVKEKPDPPFDLKIDATGSRFIELSWKNGYNGKDSIRKHFIQYKEAQNLWNDAITMETVNGAPSNSIVSHLQPAAHYVFRLFAENSIGRSISSPILRVATNEDVPSGPPLNVQVESVNTETFKVMWKAPEEKLWNGRLQGYYVGYKEVDTEDPYLFKTLLTPEPRGVENSVQISGLKQFTKYAVVVQAYNGQGSGPQSEAVVVMTSEGAPSLPPVDIRCTTLTSQTIHITWTAPPSDSINGILRGYKVVYKPASDWFDDLAESFNVTLPTSMTLYQLEKFSNYSVQVLAMTKAGDGPRSNAVFCKTLDDVPGAPTDVKVVATSDDSVIVAWKNPDHPNGVIRSFSIYWKSAENPKEAGSHTVLVRDQSYEVTKLKKGIKYEFWVTASTMAGEGAASRSVIQVPNGPTVPAKIVSFEDKIISPWKSNIDLPCHSVGIPEPTKKWLLKGKMIESSADVTVDVDGTLALKDLQEDDAGDYTCVVKNDFGEDKITYTIIILAPPSAPVIEVMTISSNVIEIQWKTPSSKMSRIKGYSLNIRRDKSDWKEINVGADVRSYRLNNLDCGTRYEIFMMAFNKIGMGDQSEILTVATNGSVPAFPTKLDLIEEASNSISLYLNTWKSNGCPIQYFVVESALKSTGLWTVISSNVKPEQRRLIIPNLKPGTWYSLRMTAHNSAGSSVANYDFATLTMTGATVLPDLMSDSSGEQLDGLWAYLNFYIIVPVACTAVILLVILGVACFCVRSRNGGSRQNRGKRVSTTELKKGDSSESFSYLQRSSLNKKHRHSKHDSTNIAPYATLQLAGQRPSTSHGSSNRDSIPPPLPPPRNENYHSGGHHQQHHHQPQMPHNRQPFFQLPPPPPMPLPPIPGDFMARPGTSETTFIFPNFQGDNGMTAFAPQYPHEAMKACFK